MRDFSDYMSEEDEQAQQAEYAEMLNELPIMNEVSKAIAMLKRIDWFHHVGDAIDHETREVAQDYMNFLGFNYSELYIVQDWDEVFPLMETNNYQTGAWEAEEAMRAGLTFRAAEQLSEPAMEFLFQFLAAALNEHIDDHITEVFANWELDDSQLKNLMMGTAMQACHTYILAKTFGDDDYHPFILRIKLYASGHWPMGFSGDSLAVF